MVCRKYLKKCHHEHTIKFYQYWKTLHPNFQCDEVIEDENIEIDSLNHFLFYQADEEDLSGKDKPPKIKSKE